ncbi:MAG: arsenate reductase ArsC, partial [Candidatus Bipolaricaulota bacterium]|nr:arsenate reductase ArsC [Candidatus Bipolaricaulota bacterium]
MTPKEGDKSDRIAVLFLCRHSAVRSQMAEALLRARFPERYEVVSAGTAPAGVHPLALRVLDEIGIPTAGL